MRLIDADSLIKNWERDRGRMFDADYFIFTIEHAPTVDAEPVVRCKDCKNWTEWENGAGSCQRSDSVMWIGTDFNDFCSFGERKEDD
jgi:hypothetical protein